MKIAHKRILIQMIKMQTNGKVIHIATLIAIPVMVLIFSLLNV